MSVVLHEIENQSVTEVTGDGILIPDAASALQFMMEAAYSGSTRIIFHQDNLAPAFFDLKTGLAGEILQKASNYRVQLAIVGNFEAVQSSSLRAFIAESNRGRQNFFVKDVASALAVLTQVTDNT